MPRAIEFKIPRGCGYAHTRTEVTIKQLAEGSDLWQVWVNTLAERADGTPVAGIYPATMQCPADAHELDLVRVALSEALPSHAVGKVVE